MALKMRNWKLWSALVIIVTILTLVIGSQSCSLTNEPDEQDYIEMSSHYDPAEIGLVGHWNGDDFYLELRDTINPDGYRTAHWWKYPHLVDGVEGYYQIPRYEHPSEYSYGRDIPCKRGVLRILGKNLVSRDYRFEFVNDSTIILTDDTRMYRMQKQ